jgi:Ala-tRNA(Pro) deacylase
MKLNAVITGLDVTEKLRTFLAEHGVAFRELEHEPTRTSEESARVRGEPLEVGAKALVMKVRDDFALFVLAADRKLDSGAIRRELGLSTLRFASPDELLALTGLVPGSVPPFGHPILPLQLFADPSVGAVHQRVAFNAGSLTRSFILAASDWRRVAKPKDLSFAR